ncbi:MAG: hypothetical protein KA419_17610 [Acidobacteria bacterium]|nr:hypothetical protein [Acidobacteriota bacterium]
MLTPAFLQPQARKMTMEAIRAVEARTSAEIVVTVRRLSGYYRSADYLFGFILALVTLAVLIFHPQPFAEAFWPLEVTAAFILGAFFCAFCPLLRRLLVPGRVKAENVLKSARSAFFEYGVFRTRDDAGVLVYVSLFERRVEVVCDKGVDASRLGPGWETLVHDLQGSLRGRGNLRQFLNGIRAMGPILTGLLPRRSDDVNELPDEVGES